LPPETFNPPAGKQAQAVSTFNSTEGGPWMPKAAAGTIFRLFSQITIPKRLFDFDKKSKL
jgi:hypothetical protein